jgi:hypothetical protein
MYDNHSDIETGFCRIQISSFTNALTYSILGTKPKLSVKEIQKVLRYN